MKSAVLVPYANRDIVSELKHREMRTGESISSYYAALVKIVDKFYRGQPSPARTALISAFFSAGFNNKSLADYVAKDKDGHTLEGALAAARQWEAFNGQKFGEDWDQAKVNKIEKDETVFEKALQDLIKLNLEQKAEADKNKTLMTGRQQSNIICYGCGRPGHVRRSCPNRPGYGNNGYGNGYGGNQPYPNRDRFFQHQGYSGRPNYRPAYYHYEDRFGYNRPMRYPHPSDMSGSRRSNQNIMQPDQSMMRQWYIQGMGDANKQHQDLVRRVNLILDEKDKACENQEQTERQMDEDAHWFFSGASNGHPPTDPATHDHRVNMIRLEMQINRRQKLGSGISHLEGILNYMMFSLLIIFILGNIGAMVSARELSDFTPDHPVICDSVMEYQGTSHLWTWPPKYQCKQANRSSETKPQVMNVRLHKRNLIEWKTKAFHCQKIRSAASTLVSFFTDSKVVNKSTSDLPVSSEECKMMSRRLACDLGRSEERRVGKECRSRWSPYH